MLRIRRAIRLLLIVAFLVLAPLLIHWRIKGSSPPYVAAIQNIATFLGGSSIAALIGTFLGNAKKKDAPGQAGGGQSAEKTGFFCTKVFLALAVALGGVFYLSAFSYVFCEFQYAADEEKKLEDQGEAPASVEVHPLYVLEHWQFAPGETDPQLIAKGIIGTVCFHYPQKDRSGPLGDALDQAPYATLVRDAHRDLYNPHYNRYMRARRQYTKGELSQEDWILAQEDWAYALKEIILPKAREADSVLAVSENRRLIAVHNRELGDVYMALGKSAEAMEAYQDSIKYGVFAMYAAVDEGKDYTLPKADASGKIPRDLNPIHDIVLGYERILEHSAALGLNETEEAQANQIVMAYGDVRSRWREAFVGAGA